MRSSAMLILQMKVYLVTLTESTLPSDSDAMMQPELTCPPIPSLLAVTMDQTQLRFLFPTFTGIILPKLSPI